MPNYNVIYELLTKFNPDRTPATAKVVRREFLPIPAPAGIAVSDQIPGHPGYKPTQVSIATLEQKHQFQWCAGMLVPERIANLEDLSQLQDDWYNQPCSFNDRDTGGTVRDLVNLRGEIGDKEFAEITRAQDKLVLCHVDDSIGSGVFLKPSAKPIQNGEIIGIYAGKFKKSLRGKTKPAAYDADTIPHPLFHDQSHGQDIDLFGSIARIDAKKHGNITRFINDLPDAKSVAYQGLPRKIQDSIATANLEFAYYSYKGLIVLVLIAKQRIKPGEQLGYDYGNHFFIDLQVAGQAIERKFFTPKGAIAKVSYGDIFNYELGLLISDLKVRPRLQSLESLLSSSIKSSAIENYQFLRNMFFTKQETTGKSILAALPPEEMADTLKQKFKILMTTFYTQHTAAQSAPAPATAAPQTETSSTRLSRRR